jgi:putative peptidoglycan lipid II flippase
MLRSIFTVSFYISLSRILGFVRDLLIAQFLGVSLLSDAFFAAFRLPNFFRRVFAEGAFNSAFVPIFIEKLHDNESGKKGELDDKQFARNIFSILLYSLLIFTVIFQLFMPTLMKLLFPGFFVDAEKSDLLISLSRITIFYLIFISIVSLLSGILNSINKFAAAAAAPIILNGTLVASIFVFGSMVPNYAYALSWGVFAAGILQFLWLFYFTFKEGFLVFPTIPKISPNTKKFFRKLLPGVIGANVMQINLLVDSIFASMIAGAVSYIYYADRINQLPLAMIGIAIGIALLPTLSRKIKSGNLVEANQLQNVALEIGLILVIPAATALALLSHQIISALFERGAFGAKETFAVASALGIYALGLPSYVLVKVMEPGFFSRGDTKTPMKIAMVCLCGNVIFNLTFFSLDFGFIGIVISSVLSTYLNLSILMTKLITKKHFSFEKKFLFKLVQILIPAIMMGFMLIELRNYFITSDTINKILELGIMIFIGLFIYAASSYFSGSFRILTGSHFLNKELDDTKIAS